MSNLDRRPLGCSKNSEEESEGNWPSLVGGATTPAERLQTAFGQKSIPAVVVKTLNTVSAFDIVYDNPRVCLLASDLDSQGLDRVSTTIAHML